MGGVNGQLANLEHPGSPPTNFLTYFPRERKGAASGKYFDQVMNISNKAFSFKLSAVS
jgi:hypothetical protein